MGVLSSDCVSSATFSPLPSLVSDRTVPVQWHQVILDTLIVLLTCLLTYLPGYIQKTCNVWVMYSVLTCVNCEVTLEVIMIPELPITKWTPTALSTFVTRLAVELPSVWIICLDIQPLSHQIQSNHFIHTHTDQQASDKGLWYDTKFRHREHSICRNRFRIWWFDAVNLWI